MSNKKDGHGGGKSAPLKTKLVVGLIAAGVIVIGLSLFDWGGFSSPSIRNPFHGSGRTAQPYAPRTQPVVGQAQQPLDPKIWDTSGPAPTVRPAPTTPFAVGAHLDDTKPFAGDLTRRRWCEMCAGLTPGGRGLAGCQPALCQ